MKKSFFKRTLIALSVVYSVTAIRMFANDTQKNDVNGTSVLTKTEDKVKAQKKSSGS